MPRSATHIPWTTANRAISDTCRTLSENGIGYFGWGENADSVKAYAEIEGRRQKDQSYITPPNGSRTRRARIIRVCNLYDEYRVCRRSLS